MIVELIAVALASIALFNLWVSWRTVRDGLSTPGQRAAHIALIWSMYARATDG